VRGMLLATDPAGYAACAAAIRDMDQRDSIKSIASKTLVIGGTRDPATGPAHAELLAGAIPDATLVMLESAHLSNIERSSEFTSALLEFLAA
jgi:3-oxoadipate enol-lactonase